MPRPLVVDLDGTLIHTDMLHESCIRVARDKPLSLLSVPFWLLKGKAHLKEQLSSKTNFNPQVLPYNGELLEWLKEQQSRGRQLVLCTASDCTVATPIAEEVGIFDDVIASDGVINLAGDRKAQALEERFGLKGFDYVGNSSTDLPVWSKARKAIVVNGSKKLLVKAEKIAQVDKVFSPRARGLSTWLKMLRVHQWLKNVLIFISLFAAHEFGNLDAWISLCLAFFAFSFCASSVYIVNDLFDLESDRVHPRKKLRPLASGVVPIWMGVVLAPILLLVSLGVACLAGGQFLPWLVFYFTLTCAYSWGLKRLILIDCFVLALLYTLRIVAGAATVGHILSFWLLAFSIFLFLSLAFVKRYAELENLLLRGKEKIHGRGYKTTDAPLLQSMGIMAGYASTLVFALYINSDAIMELYAFPQFVWGAVPVILFWVSWMWMKAHHGKMHDDPLVFAFKDKVSLLSGALVAVIMALGTVGLPWLQ